MHPYLRPIGMFEIGNPVDVHINGRWISGVVCENLTGHASDEVSVLCSEHVGSTLAKGYGVIAGVCSPQLRFSQALCSV